MTLKLKTALILSALLASTFGALPGCNQSDNPTPVTAPAPPAPKQEDVAAPKIQGKSYDPSALPKYKKMQENFAKQSGGNG
jgi:hypothetical protein